MTTRPGFAEEWAEVEPAIRAGRLSKSQAARRLGVGFATLQRLLVGEAEGEAS